MNFQPGTHPPEGYQGPALWFAFREDRLLVRVEGAKATVPVADGLGALGIVPLRVQYLWNLEGLSCCSAELPPDAPAPQGMEFSGLRQLFGLLKDDVFRLSGLAFQIMDWDRTNLYCGRCGRPMAHAPEERSKVCSECGHRSYPRVAPAVIVAVTNGERILLARARRFSMKLYSVIAGFVEPGETLEECVEREVREETGIEVKNVRYFGSQPWPFPHSLMVAFTADFAGGELTIHPDEIVDAGWFSAESLPPVPDKLSIARKLIDWFVKREMKRGKNDGV